MDDLLVSLYIQYPDPYQYLHFLRPISIYCTTTND
jgi:hypothetical protein